MRVAAVPRIPDESASSPVEARGAAAEWVALSSLVPWQRNPRKNDKAVPKVVASIQSFGWGAPILARKANREIIAGHTRFKAAQKLGLDLVPVRFLDVSEEQAHALALADNRVGEEASWDDAMLAAILTELRDSKDVELYATGFTEHEIAKLLEDSNADTSTVSLETAPAKLQRKWQTTAGQLWEIRGKDVDHRILCGSSLVAKDVARLMNGELADMMWTDPPYGVAYKGKTQDALEIDNDKQTPEQLLEFLIDCFKLAPLRPGAPWYIAHPQGRNSLQFYYAVDRVGWLHRQGLVWIKDSLVLGMSDYHYKHEPIIYGFTQGGDGRLGRGGPNWNGGNSEVTTFEVPRPKVSEFHPTMKPVELVARMVRNSSRPKGSVYEPFSGSGTTMLACEQLSRRCFSMELDPKFVAVALERMTEAGCTARLAKDEPNGEARKD